MNAHGVLVEQRHGHGGGEPVAAHGSTGVGSGHAFESQQADTATAESCSQVIDSMVHAVSNSLNSIMAASQLANLLITQDRFGEARVSLERLEEECLRAARLLRDGRNLATLEIPDSVGGADVAMLLTSCAAACSDLGEVRIECEADLPPVHAQADALKRLFVEVLDNAFQFGAHEVTVIARADGPDDVRIEFRDDGPGIRIASAKLFESFVTSEPAEHSGLGLAFAARIAAAYGGAIGLGDSSAGATFWVRLPVETTH
ncbi:MAG TPA: HAMP domain-containing sensor histidine kinase [Rhodanobacteraceae bacterium]|nr:HAMP domain-containing sensor histidine kinase [Rhodanobacteraceae bacterium]